MRLKAWGDEFTLNNNGGKFDRATQEVGERGSPEALLGVYDRLAGLILDKNGQKIPNGIFWERYSRWKEEQPHYIETLAERERILDEGEKKTLDLILNHVGHKRAFLGTLMTIAAGVIAGLFIFSTGASGSVCIKVLATISGFGFAFFILSASSYLTFLLAQESLSLDKHLDFIRDSRKDFIEKVGTAIVDLDSYERYRKERQQSEKNSRPEEKGLWEGWFIGVNGIFLLASAAILLLFVFSLLKL